MVASVGDARRLARELEAYSLGTGYPAGVDTETVGCNPKVESPVGKARVWCMTVAWGPPAEPGQETWRCMAFVRHEHLDPLVPWLEDADAGKVGEGIYAYDRHAFKNEGIELRGIAGCTKYMAKLLNPSQLHDCSLKGQGALLGYHIEKYAAVTGRPAHGPVVEPKGKNPKKGPHQNVYWGKREIIPLDELWEFYPERRQAFVQYAVRDAVMSLDVFYARQRELLEVGW